MTIAELIKFLEECDPEGIVHVRTIDESGNEIVSDNVAVTFSGSGDIEIYQVGD